MTAHRIPSVLAALAALVFTGGAVAPSRAATQPSRSTADILRGCWSSEPVADGRGRSDTYCFDPAGYLSGASIAYGTGGDFCVRWKPDGAKAVLLYFSGSTPDTCGLSVSPDGQSFDLSGCREAGHWRRDAEFDLTSWPCDASGLD